jgi:hypothetical protein
VLTKCVGEKGATYVGGILGEEGIGGLMEWEGEEGAAVCWRHSRRGGYRRIDGMGRGRRSCCMLEAF